MEEYEGFQGRIGRTHAESEPWWPTRAHPKSGSPNVIVILFDDLGFSHLGCYGSTIDTPNIDRLADEGLRFTNFHVTPLCSPTRAALLTGRNHHAVGMRSISNFNSGYPHMRGHISNNAATIAEVLRDTGYATFALGKWHLCPMTDCSAAGPFDQWPLQRGFDRFYGFLDGETDQFHPELVYDNHWIEPPGRPEDGYHLSEDLVDKAVEFVHDSVGVRPDRPFFMYLAFGATHAPHQAPQRYLEKYRGVFDEGWDVWRERWFARQKELGVIPADTELAPRNPGVEAWSDLSDNQRRLACRLQEAYAAFLDHTDDQIGRLMESLTDLGIADDTMVVLLADNGASQEGGPFGVLHEMKFFNFLIETPDEAIARIDEIGGPHSHSNYPWGWAQVGNTPFKWYKQNTHEGGIHVPCIVRWPKGLAARGEVRDQFHHVNDIVPTIYEVLGVTPPDVYRGHEQMPVSGTSMTYTFGAADAPSRKKVQYYEMHGHRAIYHDGWKAVTRHQPGTPYDADTWELYHVAVDRSEVDDLAAKEPERLAALIDLWWAEAEREGVLPLDDRGLELMGVRFAEHTPHPVDRTYVYRPPMAPLPAQAAAALGGRSWDLEAHVSLAPGQGGVIYASGTENSGMSVYVEDDRLVFDYNIFGEHHVVRSSESVPDGRSILSLAFRREGKAGSATLLIDGRDVGRLAIPFVMRTMSSVGPSVGYDHGSPVADSYARRRDGFPFEGRLDRLEIRLVRAGSEADVAASEGRAQMGRQ
ncbi:MAG: sulfatase [Acidimicrobiales bacterium mtb01]|nr:arylsulfatase [Actinomycetota bacterium]TEX45966.1 MAG: sulfatase [Acidimicrobiales bacterium mtb01]